MNAPLELPVARLSPLTAAPRIALYVRERLRPAGWPALAGVAALVAAIALHSTVTQPLRTRMDELDRRIATHGAQAQSAAAKAAVRHDLSELPTRGDVPGVVGAILQQAHGANVVLERGNYAVSPLRGGRAMRYALDFPVKAPYPAVRRFIDGCLNALPELGIDALTIERKNIGEPEVDARITFVVVSRGRP